MRRVTRDAAVGLYGSVLVNKRSLLVRMTLDARCVGARRESCLLEFETAMRIVAVTALHRAFQNLVMEGQIELMFCLTVATETKLWLTIPEQLQIRKAGLLRVRS